MMAESNRDQLIRANDQIDEGLGLLRCAFLATTSEGGILDEDVQAIGITLYQALKRLEPARKDINDIIQGMPFGDTP